MPAMVVTNWTVTTRPMAGAICVMPWVSTEENESALARRLAALGEAGSISRTGSDHGHDAVPPYCYLETNPGKDWGDYVVP
jgi:hypothetical protein